MSGRSCQSLSDLCLQSTHVTQWTRGIIVTWRKDPALYSVTTGTVWSLSRTKDTWSQGSQFPVSRMQHETDPSLSSASGCDLWVIDNTPLPSAGVCCWRMRVAGSCLAKLSESWSVVSLWLVIETAMKRETDEDTTMWWNTNIYALIHVSCEIQKSNPSVKVLSSRELNVYFEYY